MWTLRPGQYTTGYKRGQDQITHKINYAGNHAKSLRVSVDASLNKLRTPYIDILYVHWWDYCTSVEEVMDSLHTLVLQGKVLYLVRFRLINLFSLEVQTISSPRVFPTVPHGSSPKRISTPRTMERPHSAFIRAIGQSSRGPSSAI